MHDARPLPARRLRQFRAQDAWLLALALSVVALDQLTKWFIRLWVERHESYPEGGLIRIIHATNSGAAFGFIQGAAPFLAVVSLVGIAAILLFLYSPSYATHPLMRTGLALMFGGAVGNLIDRVRAGEVVDFIKLPHYPAFNLADSAITVGVIALIIATLWESKTEPASEAT